MKRPMKALLTTRLLIIALSLPLIPSAARPEQPPAWIQDALVREADYISNCSYTRYTVNHDEIQDADDAYGAINVNRIYQKGPDWVSTGEAAMGAIGLMAAARQLKAAGLDVSRYDQVLDRFFQTWVLARKQPVNMNKGSAEYGGAFQRVHYAPTGEWKSHDAVKTSVTGQLISAMWKFYEYKRATGSTQSANGWLQKSWPIARLGGDFIKRNYNPTYHLVRSNSKGGDLWISDTTYAAMGLKCLAQWAATARKTKSFEYKTLADDLTRGLVQLKDDGTKKNFFRYRSMRRRSSRPTYGDRIDQTCFLPYEADVLDPGEAFARSISDWWTNGSDGIRMTFRVDDPADWRYYGTHWRYFFKGAAENNNLYPGAGLQLAKVEWKYARRTGDRVTMERAQKRLEWAYRNSYSNLWCGVNGTMEANVPNGLIDWRDANNYTHKADDWARFVDTSAYFIEGLLMLAYNVDTRYVPG